VCHWCWLLAGCQFHPEKPAFEWAGFEHIAHSNITITSMQYFSEFFVSETRRNHHSFISDDAVSKALIYNYCPVFTNSYFMQEYVFSPNSPQTSFSSSWWTLGKVIALCVASAFMLVFVWCIYRCKRQPSTLTSRYADLEEVTFGVEV